MSIQSLNLSNLTILNRFSKGFTVVEDNSDDYLGRFVLPVISLKRLYLKAKGLPRSPSLLKALDTSKEI